jgi:hypothetical protein
MKYSGDIPDIRAMVGQKLLDNDNEMYLIK